MPKVGDIVLVPFLFTDLTQHKMRPAVVVGIDAKANHVILCYMTSQAKLSKFKVYVKSSPLNGLNSDSYILPSKIMTLEKKILLGAIGRLEKEYYEEVKGKLKSIFNL